MKETKIAWLVWLFVFVYNTAFCQQNARNVDVCIYGGTSAGVIAAYTAGKTGKSVLLIEPGKNLGGLSSGGLGFTDIGNKSAISRLALEFYRISLGMLEATAACLSLVF